MKQQFRLFQRNGVYYAQNNSTSKQESLRTKDRKQAVRLIQAKNDAQQQPLLNLHLAKAYWLGADPNAASRTWQHVIEQHVIDTIVDAKQGETRLRWLTAAKDKSFDGIRNLNLLETRAEHFHTILRTGTVSTNVYLRRIHNYALDMNWLPCSLIPKRLWPAVRYGEKRAITEAEHKMIIEREQSPERRAFYELCWHLGGSQGDIASLQAEDVDWNTKTIAYFRKKTKTAAVIQLGESEARILKERPVSGPLFPYLITVRSCDRATEFKQRCHGLSIRGVTLHSYRYAWAERAKACGYNERFAQEALGHNSKAVHRAYAKRAKVTIPALEIVEREARSKIVNLRCQSSKVA
jgi:integrase